MRLGLAALPALLVTLALAALAAADPISRAQASATIASDVAAMPAEDAPPAAEGGRSWAGWPMVLAGLCVLAALGMLLWSLDRSARRFLERDKVMRKARRQAERMLYTDLSLDEAQRIVWAFEEMTEAERAELPLERRVEIRKISADLESHKRRWNLT